MSTPVRKVLVVDDEPAVRWTLASILELEGFEVAEAVSGESALAALASRPFDVVVTDIRMPGMNGVELFHEVHRRFPELPVLLMTAFAQEELIESALSEGAWALLSKPFDVDHAVQVIARAANAPAVLVMDDTTFAEQTVGALQSRGLRAVAALDADDARELLDDGVADVCVLDVACLGHKGAALFAQLRAANPSLKGIAIGFNHDVPQTYALAALGVQTFFSRPFSARDLVRSIARARASRS